MTGDTTTPRPIVRLPHPAWLLLAGLFVAAALLVAVAYFHPTARLIRSVELLGGSVTTQSGVPDWLRDSFGERWLFAFDRIVAIDLDDTAVTDDWLARLAGREDLQALHLNRTSISDSGIASLRDLPNLQELYLFQTDIGDDALKHLQSFPQLAKLDLGHSRVTDAGLAHLATMTQLDFIGLRGCRVSDAGLEELRRLTNLTGLHLAETGITDGGLRHLQSLRRLQKLNLGTVSVWSIRTVPLSSAATMAVGDITVTPLDYVNIGPEPADRMQVTDSGVEELKQAIPGLNVEFERWVDLPILLDAEGLPNPSFIFTGEIIAPDFGSRNP